MSERPSTPESFVAHLAIATAEFDDRRLVQQLEAALSDEFPADGGWFASTVVLCRRGVDNGWLCGRGGSCVKFGRAVLPGDQTRGFSGDVLEMQDVIGRHHAHPSGEIDPSMPLDQAAEFEVRGAGWLVYRLGSVHKLRVVKSQALAPCLLPNGEFDFSGLALSFVGENYDDY